MFTHSLLDENLNVYLAVIDYLKENDIRGLKTFKLYIALGYDTYSRDLELTPLGMSMDLFDMQKDERVEKKGASIGVQQALLYGATMDTLREYLVSRKIIESAYKTIRELEQEKLEIRKDTRQTQAAQETAIKGVDAEIVGKHIEIAIAKEKIRSLTGVDNIDQLNVDEGTLDEAAFSEAVEWCEENGIKVGITGEDAVSSAASVWAEKVAEEADFSGVRKVNLGLKASILSWLSGNVWLYSTSLSVGFGSGSEYSKEEAEVFAKIKNMFAEQATKAGSTEKANLQAKLEIAYESLNLMGIRIETLRETLRKHNMPGEKFKRPKADYYEMLFEMNLLMRQRDALVSIIEDMERVLGLEHKDYKEPTEQNVVSEDEAASRVVSHVQTSGSIAENRLLAESCTDRLRAIGAYKGPKDSWIGTIWRWITHRSPVGLGEVFNLSASYQEEGMEKAYGWLNGVSVKEEDITTLSAATGLELRIKNLLGLVEKHINLTREVALKRIELAGLEWAESISNMIVNIRSLKEQRELAERKIKATERKVEEVKSDETLPEYTKEEAERQLEKAKSEKMKIDVLLQVALAQFSSAMGQRVDDITADDGIITVERALELLKQAKEDLGLSGKNLEMTRFELSKLLYQNGALIVWMERFESIRSHLSVSKREYNKQISGERQISESLVTDDGSNPILNPITGQPQTESEWQAYTNTLSRTDTTYFMGFEDILTTLGERYSNVRYAKEGRKKAKEDLAVWIIEFARMYELSKRRLERAI